jgi:hypothetical protein
MDLMQRHFEQEGEIGKLKDQIKDLGSNLSPELETPATADVSLPLDHSAPPEMHSLDYAKKWRVCRICGESTIDGSNLPIKLSYGEEHAHQSCLLRQRA